MYDLNKWYCCEWVGHRKQIYVYPTYISEHTIGGPSVWFDDSDFDSYTFQGKEYYHPRKLRLIKELTLKEVSPYIPSDHPSLNLNFNVGDIVLISDSSCYKSQGCDGNGDKITGTIDRIVTEDDHCYKVVWSNGTRNSYRDIDLELYTEDSAKSVEPTTDEKFEVGDFIEALPSSNAAYNITTKEQGFVGKILQINSFGKLTVEAIRHKSSNYIGEAYTSLESRHFKKIDSSLLEETEPIQEETKIKEEKPITDSIIKIGKLEIHEIKVKKRLIF
jgi:hypothetical protein